MSTNLSEHFDQQSYLSKLILAEFKKPITENVFFINKKVLKFSDSTEYYNFNRNEWVYSPHVFCYDVYDKQQYLFPIILLVNDIGSILEFTPENLDNIIIAPGIDIIEKVSSFV
jgi:hypothetical protein